ncbi:MAG: FAD binding domain-containing protein [Microbacterium sp.]
MDLNTVTSFRRATTRADLALGAGERPLAGGTFLFSDPNPVVTGLVDLTTMGWPSIETTAGGLRIGSTCTIAELVDLAEGRGAHIPPAEWTALPLFVDAANALLMSFKIWHTATVGGNIAQSFAAGALIAACATLDGEALILTPDGGERRMPVAEIPRGNGENTLAAGEIIRHIDIPVHALRSRTVLHKLALAELGRSGSVVSARRDEDGSTLFCLTASVERPVLLRWPEVPSRQALAEAVADADGYYTDPLGSADWRRGTTVVLAERSRLALMTGADA